MQGESNNLKRKCSADDDGEDDDEWSDVSSDDSARPVEGNSDFSDEELALLPYMPSLFDDELPPCGLIPQIAYENIIRRMRKLWVQHATDHSVNIHISKICKKVVEDLCTEAENQPIDSQLDTKARRPWRRKNVFKYEISWATYFTREAELFERRPKMNEQELDKQEFMEKLFPIPKELGIYVENNLNKEWVFGMWRAWHHKKRGTVPQDGKGLGCGGARDDEGAERTEDVHGEGRTDGVAGNA